MMINGSDQAGQASARNEQMIASLRDALAKAEAGTLTDFIGVALGPGELAWQAINVINPVRMIPMVGELNIITQAVCQIIINGRAEAVQAQMAKQPRVLMPRPGGRFE